MSAQRFCILGGDRKLEALGLTAARGERVEDALLGLRTEAVQLAHTTVAGGPRELFDRMHVEFVVERTYALGTEPRHLQHLRDTRRRGALQLGQQPALSGLDDLADLGGKVFADAGQLGEVFAVRKQLGDRHAERFEFTRGIAIGTHAERIGVFDLQQIGDLLEQRGNLCIVYWHRRLTVPRRAWELGLPDGVRRPDRRDLPYPLIQTNGSSFATLRARPAASAASTTAVTSL